MKHKIITFGELMLRLSPDNNERFTQAHSYEAVYGGGEANTAVSLANFNVNVSYVTKLPEHTIGQSAAVGPGGVVDGKEVTMQVKPGDKVIYSKYAGTEVKLDDEEYIVVKQNDILAVIED